MPKLYSYDAVQKAIETVLAPAGYEIIEIPGCLIDSYVCVAPDDDHYNVIFKETYLNQWSSAYTVRNYRKLPKWATDAISSADGTEVSA